MNLLVNNSWTVPSWPGGLCSICKDHQVQGSTGITNNINNSWTRLVSSLSTRSLFIPVTHSYREYCSDFAGGNNNSEQEESWNSKEGLVRCSANHVPLSPIGFLERAAKAYRDRTSIIYGSLKHTWAQTHQRCLKLASALTQLGISRGDVVSVWFFFFISIPSFYFLRIHLSNPN
jgi:hypothetical protein